jgi:hypothetical protein
MGQKFAAYNSAGNIIAFYDSEDSPVPVGETVIEISDADWQSCINTQGYTVANGVLVSPPTPTVEDIAAKQAAIAWAAYQVQARNALSLSDITVLRCYENSIALPAEWVTYRKSLRSIINSSIGDATQPLPIKPDYPSGS